MKKNMVRLGASGVEVSLTGKGAVSALIATLLVISPLMALPMEAQAATFTTGTLYPTSVVDDATNGGAKAWTNPGNAAALDGTAASTASLNGGDKTHFLRAAFNLSAIPNGATIDGVTVVVRKRGSSANRVADDQVFLKTATATSSNMATSTLWGASLANTTYGSASETWGLTLDGDDVNGAGFYVLFSGKRDTSNPNAFVDSISIEVTYSVGAPPDGMPPVISEITPVPAQGTLSNPEYVFQSDEDGSVVYGGDCAANDGSLTSITASTVSTTTLGTLSDGVHTCTINVVDAATNVSNTLTLNFEIDSTGPSTNVSSSVIGVTGATTVPFQVMFSEDVSDFDEFDVNVTNGAIVPFSFFPVSATTYTFDVAPTIDGDVDVSVSSGMAHDAFGNSNTSGTYTIQFDSTAPAVLITSPAEGSVTNDATPTVTFSLDDAAVAECEMDGDDFDCLGDTSFTPVDDLDDGEHTFTITAEDVAMNEFIAEVSFFVDTTAPTVDLSSSLLDPTKVSPITMTAEFSEPVTGFDEGEIDVTNGSVDSGSLMGSGDTYTFTVTPDTEGLVEITVQAGAAEDVATNGSEVSDTFEITYDVTPPILTIDSGPADGSNNGPDVEFTFTSDESNVECDVDGNGFAACDSSSNEELNGLSDGTHTFTVRATDDAGNVTTLPTVTFDVDATGPVLTEITAVPTTAENREPKVTVSIDDDADIAFSGACVSALTGLTEGEHEIVFDELAPGTYSDCTITGTDSYGNEGPILALTSFEITEAVYRGGGSGGRRDPQSGGEVQGAQTGPVEGLGNLITNLFGGNTGGTGAAGEDTGGVMGAGTDGDSVDQGVLPQEVKLAASAAGFDVSNPWVILLILLILLVLAGLGYWTWKSFKKA